MHCLVCCIIFVVLYQFGYGGLQATLGMFSIHRQLLQALGKLTSLYPKDAFQSKAKEPSLPTATFIEI
jgi:hypothetical protein